MNAGPYNAIDRDKCKTPEEKEHAAKAIECGYLYSENDMLYTKILMPQLAKK